MLLNLTALLAGIIFGLGLILSGMSNPEKVLGFLDIAGNWDPSLGLVMGGAIAITLPAFLLLKKRKSSFLSQTMQWPTRTDVDKRLIVGSVLFGIGWGIAGFCPGPALLSISTGTIEALIFFASMLAGMALFKFYERIQS